MTPITTKFPLAAILVVDPVAAGYGEAVKQIVVDVDEAATGNVDVIPTRI